MENKRFIYSFISEKLIEIKNIWQRRVQHMDRPVRIKKLNQDDTKLILVY